MGAEEGGVVLGIGEIIECFQARGRDPVLIDKLKMAERG